MLNSQLMGQLLLQDVEKEIWRESHIAAGPPAGSVDQLQGCTQSGSGRKRGKGRRARERWSVAKPEEEAGMTQAAGLWNQGGREREERGRGRHTGDSAKREHTHFCNLIRGRSRLLPSASKGY